MVWLLRILDGCTKRHTLIAYLISSDTLLCVPIIILSVCATSKHHPNTPIHPPKHPLTPTNLTSQQLCDQGKYCPPRSTEEVNCEKGFYCASPSEKVACSSGSYCPEGSTEDKSCGAGYFCQTPDDRSL